MTVRVALIVLGDAGAGHIVRALAIHRAIRRVGADVHLHLIHAGDPWDAIPMPPNLANTQVIIRPADYRTPATAANSPLSRAVRDAQPDLLVCDLHWAPLQQVLAAGVDAPAWLLLRSHPPIWLRGPTWLPFTPSRWTRILTIEPLALSLPHEQLDPITIANPDEAQPPGALRERLGLSQDDTLTVLMQAGKPGFIDRLEGETLGHVHRADLHAPGALFPICTWLHDADRVLCGGGYNSFWEATRMGYAERTRFTACPTRIDDQAWRIRACRNIQPEANGADTLARKLAQG